NCDTARNEKKPPRPCACGLIHQPMLSDDRTSDYATHPRGHLTRPIPCRPEPPAPTLHCVGFPTAPAASLPVAPTRLTPAVQPLRQLQRVRLDHARDDARMHVLAILLGLDQSGRDQLLHVVRNGRLRNREELTQLLVRAAVIGLCDLLQQTEPPRIGERLGDALELSGQ